MRGCEGARVRGCEGARAIPERRSFLDERQRRAAPHASRACRDDRRDRDTSADPPGSAAGSLCRRSSRSSRRARCCRQLWPARRASRRRHPFPSGVPLTYRSYDAHTRSQVPRRRRDRHRMQQWRSRVSRFNDDRHATGVDREGRTARRPRGREFHGAAADGLEPRRARELARAGRSRVRAEVCRARERRVVAAAEDCLGQELVRQRRRRADRSAH